MINFDSNGDILNQEQNQYRNQDLEKQINQLYDNNNQISIQQQTKEKQIIIEKQLPLQKENLQIQKFKRYYGKTCVIMHIKNEPLFTLGPDFKIFIGTWISFLILGYYLTFKYSVKKGKVIYILTFGINFLQIISYLLTALLNPGIAIIQTKQKINKKQKKHSFCDKCQIIKNQGIYHCFECDICIQDYDHHCPWTGKCIGKGNMFFFKIFICCTFFYFFYCFFLFLL
ncbi:hypothetical protein IMG5_001550 [Ichthyophthirius multifiliis]|uniref:Palmitoyltransferase n=1 Tax=Ichthyophthirius multifiliis TaxID=5932 RepID=G0QIZ4_ICHMU|nr:hypothetical protein IMG5_001550 [Ichthyophthirius multifiliis]EGR34814.1 hypothetical protein IMG5_001550 [Ichthyophthirius multifiliis]|eukprot:XP_004040118.1 hypothetical protein IMG5_001550 [Ichthyophthirius multifiliis]